MLTDALRFLKSKLHTALNSSDSRAKVQDSDFVIGLLQAVAQAKGNFSLAGLNRSMCTFLGIKIGRSAFNERLGTASLVRSLQLALAVLIATLIGNNSSASSLLKRVGVKEIIGIDASMVTLWDGLCHHFKGTFMHAAVKLHLAINLISGSIRWFEITSGATHDSRCFPGLSKGSLYIFDLGYWSGKLLQKISDHSAFFLSRLKASAKLTVTKVIQGMGESIVGHDLLSFPVQRRRKTIVELLATTLIDGAEVQFRVIGFWHKKDRVYRWYITNLKCARGLIYNLYRLRWQVELSFKAMKSTLNFDRIPTLNHNAVAVFTLVALINYVFATIVREEARVHAINGKKSGANSASIQRGAIIFSIGANAILDLVRLGRRLTKRAVTLLIERLLPLLSEVLDPNHNKRKTSLGRLQNA
jgi:hypothetical protein